MVYSDSHSHMHSYPTEKLESVLNEMKAKHVDLVLNVGMTLETSQETVNMAQKHSNLPAAVGIHPGMAVPLTEDVKKRLEELSSKPRVVAFGEIGIEYLGLDGRPIPISNIEIQKELFLYQVFLAKNAHLPVNIHYSMDAQDDIVAILRREKCSGIAHAFQGTLKDLQAWLDIGFYISIGAESLGIRRTIKDAPPVSVKVVQAIPPGRLLTETDSMFRDGKSHGPFSGRGTAKSSPGRERVSAAGGCFTRGRKNRCHERCTGCANR